MQESSFQKVFESASSEKKWWVFFMGDITLEVVTCIFKIVCLVQLTKHIFCLVELPNWEMTLI